MQTISRLSHQIIYYAFIALFFLTPLVFYPFTKYFPLPWFVFNVDPFTYELFEFNKMYFVYGLAIIVGTAWIVKSLAEKKVIFRRTFPDYALALFLISQILSTIFSIDVHTSWWGYYSRSHGGLLSTISYLVLYWAFVSNLFEQRYVHKMLIASIMSATLVSLYGIGQHFGVDAEYWVQNVRARVFSSMGQPNWLAAYLVALIPVSLSYFIFEKRLGYKLAYLFTTAIMFLSFLFTASRSGLLAIVIGMILYAALVYGKRVHGEKTNEGLWSYLTPLLLAGGIIVLYVFGYYKFAPYALNLSLALLAFSFLWLGYSLFRTQRVWVGILGVIIVVMGFFYFSPEAFRFGQTGVAANSPTALPQEAGGTETGRIRFIVWKGAWDIFKRYPVFGSGVESFAYAFYQDRPLELLKTTEWDFLYNKAHNEYMNFLATTGAFGLGVYLFYILHVLYFGYRSYVRIGDLKKEKEEPLIVSKNKKQKSERELVFDENYVVLLLISIICGFVTILITNFFGFSVVIVAVYFFMFVALMAGLLSHERPSWLYKTFVARINSLNFTFHKSQPFVYVGIVVVLLVSSYMLLQLFAYWFADIAFSKGRSYNRQGDIGQAHTKFVEAVALRQDEPFYYSELGWTQSNMVYSLMRQNDASTAAELAPLAEENARRAVEKSPNNINYWKKLADAYYNLSLFDEKGYAEKLSNAIDRTQTLAPTDVSTLLTLSTYYEHLGRLDDALRIVEQASKWKEDLGEAWYRLGELNFRKYQETKDERYRILSEEYQYKATQLEPANEDFKRGYE